MIENSNLGTGVKIFTGATSSTSSGNISKAVDISSYKLLIILLRYGNIIYDSKIVTVNIFKKLCTGSQNAINVNMGNNGKCAANVWYSNGQIVAYINTPYYPIDIYAI